MTASPVSKDQRFNGIKRVLCDDCGLDPNLPLVVGFSGGADSLCLLSLLADLGWNVTAAHFDHRLRPESGRDAECAAALAQRIGVAFILGAGDVAGTARETRLSIEAAAREMRYAFLFQTARGRGAQAVSVAHTADDQAETLLLHFLRGAGLAGLKGMLARSVLSKWDVVTPLVRPLLGFSRVDTEAWCRERGLDAVEDPSNRDLSYARNRVRHELIPLLEGYNPNIRQTLARNAAALSGDYALVTAAVERAWSEVCRARGEGWIEFALPGLRALDEGLLRGTLRRAALEIRPGSDEIAFEDVARAAGFVQRPTASGQCDFAAGLRLLVEEDRLYCEEPGAAPLPEHWPQLLEPAKTILAVPGETRLAKGWSIHAERLPLPAALGTRGDESEAWLDAACLTNALALRPARPGERLQPLGMGGRSQKLSDLWVNARVPRRARRLYPVVWQDETAVWVPGLRLAESFRVTADTCEVVHLVLIKNLA